MSANPPADSFCPKSDQWLEERETTKQAPVRLPENPDGAAWVPVLLYGTRDSMSQKRL